MISSFERFELSAASGMVALMLRFRLLATAATFLPLLVFPLRVTASDASPLSRNPSAKPVAQVASAAPACRANVSWSPEHESTDGKNSNLFIGGGYKTGGGEDLNHRVLITVLGKRFGGHVYWALSGNVSAFPGSRIRCWDALEANGTRFHGSGDWGFGTGETCTSGPCPTRIVSIRLRVVAVGSRGPSTIKLAPGLSAISNRSTASISGQLEMGNGKESAKQALEFEWWSLHGVLSHFCQFYSNYLEHNPIGLGSSYLFVTQPDGTFTATVPELCFPAAGRYFAAVTEVGAYTARSKLFAVSVRA